MFEKRRALEWSGKVETFNVAHICAYGTQYRFLILNKNKYILSCTVETAMGVSKKTQKKSGFEYAEAVMKWVNTILWEK